jgi:ADP-dependent NAD(P)H-hydrate dehydratase / NAD(P)H-hydrate epimerase
MKILPVEKIREADAFTILHEPVKSVDLMERAAAKCFKWLKKRVVADRPVKVFCGTGNNGGDGLVIARMMAEYHADISVYVTRYTDKCSDDFLINYQKLQDIGSVECVDLKEGDDLPPIGEGDVVIDAIFGSGLSKPIKDYPAAVIRHINAAKALVVAIDMPSGLFGDVHTDPRAGVVIHADYTLTFQFPKLAFMFPENDSLVGEWKVLDIGLHPDFIRKADVKNFILTRQSASGLLKHRTKFAHKGNFGHALLIAGGYGRMGAAVLASEACLRSGWVCCMRMCPGKPSRLFRPLFPKQW